MDVSEKKMIVSRFPVVFASDVGYVPHLATALYSLLVNNQSLALDITVITSGIPKEDRLKLEKVCAKFGAPLDFKELDDDDLEGLVLSHHFKKSNYYRLFAENLIQGEKCLYLDADIIVNGSIAELVEMNLNDFYLAAVEEPVFDRHAELGMRPDSAYFNSGVMLLNLDKWRRNNLKNLVISFVKKRPESIQFVDQCGLNGVVDGEWVELDVKYNFQASMLKAGELIGRSSERKPIVVHFTGSSKPWHMNNRHSYKKLYWSYRNRTPYKALLPDDFSLTNMARSVLPASIKKFVKSSVFAKGHK